VPPISVTRCTIGARVKLGRFAHRSGASQQARIETITSS